MQKKLIIKIKHSKTIDLTLLKFFIKLSFALQVNKNDTLKCNIEFVFHINSICGIHNFF